MKKLITIIAALGLMAMMITPAFAETQYVRDEAGSTVPFVDQNGTDMPVYATTTQIDSYKATIFWGPMEFAYDFGTWDAATHQWTGEMWASEDFNDTNNIVNVANDSSQPLSAAFKYGAGAKGDTTLGTFFQDSELTIGTGVGMPLALCPVSGPAPSDDTYLKLEGRPAANIGSSAVEIGNITVTLNTTGLVAEAARLTTASLGAENAVAADLVAVAGLIVTDGYTVTILGADGTVISAEGVALTTGVGSISFTVTETATGATVDTSLISVTIV